MKKIFQQSEFIKNFIFYFCAWTIMTALFLIVRYHDINEKYGVVDPGFSWGKQIPETLAALVIVTLLFALIEPAISSRKLNVRSISYVVFSKSIIYIFILFLFFTILSYVENLTENNFNFALALEIYFQRLSGKRFQLIMIYMSFGMIIIQFVRQTSRMIGEKFFWNLIRGKYFKPKRENIILMFLDLKNSTMIAEKLGHLNYSEFMQKYYYDISFPIKEAKGHIYQYVGDEIVIYWETEKGLAHNYFLKCFFEARQAIDNNKNEYMTAFNHVPEFKAGIHCGEIITSQVGNFKAEIAFHGDVINTVARIVAKCTELDADLLISGDLYHKTSAKQNYIFNNLGKFILRGKSETTEIFSVESVNIK